MKAITFTRYGTPDVLEWKEVERPSPGEGEVLVRVHAVSLNDWDVGALEGTSFVNRMIFGLLKPKKRILGSDIAGRVAAVGENVQRFQVGDEVFGDLSGRWGGFAEYASARESALALKAPGMSFEEAAAIPQAAMLALQALGLLGELRTGQRLLINGAGGGVGTFALQMAKREGVEVTAVDRPEKFDLLRSLGAAHVIDYTQEDFTRRGERYDLILDVKTTRSVRDCARALSSGGIYVTVGGSMMRLLQALWLGPWISMTQKKSIRLLSLKPNQGLEEMKKLFEAGEVRPVIDGPYPLRDAPKAFRTFMEGRHRGKVVFTVGLGPSSPA